MISIISGKVAPSGRPMLVLGVLAYVFLIAELVLVVRRCRNQAQTISC